MTNDSDKFITRVELEKQGWKPGLLNRWTRKVERKMEEAVPLYEGKMVQMYDHRAADVVMNMANLARPAQQLPIDDGSKEQFDRFPTPQYWMRSDDVATQRVADWSIAFKSITSPTNMRTMMASVIPQSGVGNSMALFAAENPLEEAQFAPLLLANMCSFVLDFTLRQKVQGQNLNWFIVEQLPVIAPRTT